jgi:hypothetical protein
MRRTREAALCPQVVVLVEVELVEEMPVVEPPDVLDAPKMSVVSVLDAAASALPPDPWWW